MCLSGWSREPSVEEVLPGASGFGVVIDLPIDVFENVGDFRIGAAFGEGDGGFDLLVDLLLDILHEVLGDDTLGFQLGLPAGDGVVFLLVFVDRSEAGAR